MTDPIADMLTRAYWAKGRTREMIARYVQHSLVFGLYDGEKQIGLARIVRALEAAGAFAKRDTDRKRYTKKYRLPGGSTGLGGGSAGLYVIDPERLESEGAGHA